MVLKGVVINNSAAKFFQEIEDSVAREKLWDSKHPILAWFKNSFYSTKRFVGDHLHPRMLYRRTKVVLYWIPLTWELAWWDWSFIPMVLRHQIRYMVKNWDKAWHMDSEAELAEMKEVLIILDRIVEDRYYETHAHLPDHGWDDVVEEDMREAMRLIGQNFRKWWD